LKINLYLDMNYEQIMMLAEAHIRIVDRRMEIEDGS